MTARRERQSYAQNRIQIIRDTKINESLQAHTDFQEGLGFTAFMTDLRAGKIKLRENAEETVRQRKGRYYDGDAPENTLWYIDVRDFWDVDAYVDRKAVDEKSHKEVSERIQKRAAKLIDELVFIDDGARMLEQIREFEKEDFLNASG